MTERKHKWQHNSEGGYSLMVWHEGTPVRNNGGVVVFRLAAQYRGLADVFKAKKGNRWIVRWLSKDFPRRWEQGNAPTLREAMRLARAMVGINHGK